MCRMERDRALPDGGYNDLTAKRLRRTNRRGALRRLVSRQQGEESRT